MAVTQFKEANRGKKYNEESLEKRLASLYGDFDEALKQYYQNVKLQRNKRVINVQPTILRDKLEVELAKLIADFQDFLKKIERD